MDTKKVCVTMASAGCERGPDPWDGNIWDDDERGTDPASQKEPSRAAGESPGKSEKRYSEDSEKGIPHEEMLQIQDTVLYKV